MEMFHRWTLNKENVDSFIGQVLLRLVTNFYDIIHYVKFKKERFLKKSKKLCVASQTKKMHYKHI